MTPKEKAFFLELRMLKGFICGLAHVSQDKAGAKHILNEIRKMAKKINEELDEESVVKDSLTTERDWVGLTDEEIGTLTVFDGLHHVETPLLADFVQAIEAKLKEKNSE